MDLVINNDVIPDIIQEQDNTEIPPQASPIFQTQQPQEVLIKDPLEKGVVQFWMIMVHFLRIGIKSN